MALTAKELVENSWLVSQDSEDCVCFLDEALQVIQSKDRALWLARAMRAKDNANWYDLNLDKLYKNWQWVERKCRAKAKEFE